MPQGPFTPEALRFLRGLSQKKNNTREWFEPRKPVYERELKAPMLALIDQINHALLDFAPDHVRLPQKTMLRIYRDIRFAADKRPYKSHISAWWARSGMAKTSGAGFYFHLGATEIIIAAGVFMPDRDQLLAIRRHLLQHHAELRRLLADRRLKALFGPLEGRPLSRPPKGFSDLSDPNVAAALDLLRCREWGISATLPVEAALEPTLPKQIIDRFRHAAPLVNLLNAPLTAAARQRPPRPLF